MPKTDKITSDRLLIRPVASGDTKAIHEYACDQGITMMMYLPNETIDETKEFVKYAVSQWQQENPNDREYVIIFQNQIIGGINLEHVESEAALEIGWTIHKAYRNQGFATEAASNLMEYAFHDLSAERVIAHCDSQNIASEKVMQKLHMKLVNNSGTRYYPKTGVTSGELLYGITQKEYQRMKDSKEEL